MQWAELQNHAALQAFLVAALDLCLPVVFFWGFCLALDLEVPRVDLAAVHIYCR